MQLSGGNSMDHPFPTSGLKGSDSGIQHLVSQRDARLINPGPPAVYQLNTERKYIDGIDKNVRQWTYGRRDTNKKNKVILMVGETGSGKTTLINTMINYILGVKFEDQEWYEITEEEKQDDQTQSQTSEITVYEVFVEENPTSLTIIDTPGYGDTGGYEEDGKISEYLRRLFSDDDGIEFIDAVYFVMKASQNRLSGKELYIFHSVLSLFGKDIENNIVFLLTYSDGGPPADALSAIEKAEIPCRRDEDNQPVHFLFNNRQKEKRNKHYEQTYRSAWEMGERSMKEFFTLLEANNRKCVQMTLEVLKERRQLEACVCNLVARISEKELKTAELIQTQEALKQNRDKIEKCENFEFTVNKVVKRKVSIENESWRNNEATCCSECEENCHEFGCWCAPSQNLFLCEVIKNGHCTACSRKCHYSKHVKENKKYVTTTESVIMTFEELKQQYDQNDQKPEIMVDEKIFQNTKKKYEGDIKESKTKTEIEKKLIEDLDNIKYKKSDLVHESYMCIMSLCKIALKADSAFTLQHVDFLIPRLEEEGKHEWKKNLEDMKKAGEEPKNKGAVNQVKALFKAQPQYKRCYLGRVFSKEIWLNKGIKKDNEFKPARRIVLLGKTGDGKSSSGNTILCEELFKTESSPQSITSECKSEVATVDGRRITVIDTPGIFDTRLDEEVIKTEIIKATIECAPAVDALVIVLKVERYTRQEVEILNKITEYCGEETFKHAVVLFTHAEQLDGQTIEEFVHKSPKLEELVNKCEGRCHIIDNKYWNDCESGEKSNRVQVRNLLETIDKMVMENGCYTNELMLETEDEIQEEMKGLLKLNLSVEETRKTAKEKVLKRFIIRFAGVTTGILVGAFMGVGVALFSVVALLKAAKLKDMCKAIGIAVTAAGTLTEKAAVAAAAGGTAAVGSAAVSGAAAAAAAVVDAGVAVGAGAGAAAGAVAAEASVAAGAIAVEAGAAGAGIGAAAGSGIAVGVILGTAALAGAVGGGVTGYKAAGEADSVLDAIKIAAKTNYANAKEVVKKAEELPSNIYKKFQ